MCCRPIAQVEAWAREHSHILHPSDMALAWLVETATVVRPWVALRSTNLPSHLVRGVCDDVATLIRNVRCRWFDTDRQSRSRVMRWLKFRFSIWLRSPAADAQALVGSQL